MIHSNTISLDRNIDLKKFHFSGNPIYGISKFRDAILSMTQEYATEDEYKLISFCQYKTPCLLYAKPNKNSLRLYGLGEDGLKCLNVISKAVMSKRQFSLLPNDQNEYEYYNAKASVIKENCLDFLPRTEKNVYEIATPLLLFTNNARKVYDKIWNGGRNQEYEIDIQKASIELIKDNLTTMLSDTLKMDMSVAVENIDLKWESFKIKPTYYHISEKTPTPGIFGRLASSHSLPPFIGLKIGKGFGELCKIKAV